MGKKKKNSSIIYVELTEKDFEEMKRLQNILIEADEAWVKQVKEERRKNET